MNKLLFLNIVLFLNTFTLFCSDYRKTFYCGIHYGLSLSTIYKYTNDFNYFDKLNYGKRITGSIGISLDKYFTKSIFFETGMYYALKGTRYKYYTYRTQDATSTSTHVASIHYIDFPIIVCSELLECNRFTMRYGLKTGYQFDYSISEMPIDEEIIKDFDIGAVIGIKINPSKVEFFKNNKIVIDYCFSLFSIIKPEKEFLLQNEKDFNILSNQRNMSITLSFQYLFKN